MGDHDTKPTCLSSEEHEGAIRDHILHYLGCIEIEERSTFFSQENPLWEIEIQHETKRLLKEGKIPDEALADARKCVEEKREYLHGSCHTELRRISKLRGFLWRDREEKHLIDSIRMSGSKWRRSAEFDFGIHKVKEWRSRRQHQRASSVAATFHASQPGPAVEHHAHRRRVSNNRHTIPSIISPDTRTSASHDSAQSASIEQERPPPTPTLPPLETIMTKSEYDPEKDINVYILRYGEVESFDEPAGTSKDLPQPSSSARYRQKEPDMKKKVGDLLQIKPREGKQEITEDDRVNHLLHISRDKNKLRYIHLPSNNMVWVEEAIARYFGEDRPDYDGIHRELQGSQKTQTYMLLRPQFWRGQQHGGRSAPPHARHMRSLCEIVSSNPNTVDRYPKNVVLFMPYLHWETDRQRSRLAHEIESITDRHFEERKTDEKTKKAARVQERMDLPKPSWYLTQAKSKPQTWASICAQWLCHSSERDDKSATDATGRAQIAPLVNHQSHASNNAVAPNKGRFRRKRKGNDEQRHKHHGHKRPGLERNQPSRIRSFRELMEMWGWDRDGPLPVDENGRVEVKNPLGQYLIDAARLYEGMSNYRDKKLLHRYLHHDPPLHPRRTLDQAYYTTLNTTKHRDRDQVVYRGTTAKREDYHTYDPDKKVWEKHLEQDLAEGDSCETCRTHIRKVSRVVMVDQLWMWILNENTILTCFPKRYGANKHDVSGVHKSIREKLDNARHNHIRTIYDLALVILEECSNTFFDKSKTADRQPQVMDIFSEAIGNVVCILFIISPSSMQEHAHT